MAGIGAAILPSVITDIATPGLTPGLTQAGALKAFQDLYMSMPPPQEHVFLMSEGLYMALLEDIDGVTHTFGESALIRGFKVKTYHH